MLPEVVSAEEWQRGREALLVKEKALTRAFDELAAERRRLPMVRFGEYAFEGVEGTAGLGELFEGRRQLIVYQMMDLGSDGYCNGCSSFVDNIGHLAHLNARDTTFVVVSDMPAEQLFGWRRRMGWTMPFYSSRGTTFAADCGFNSGFGLSVFLRDADHTYRTYSTQARGVDRLRPDFNLLDLTPLGRQEEWEDTPPGRPQTPTMAWLRHHDEYGDANDRR
ncbi:DUF899 domain-containing protein [Kribbella sandramycini]|uniref:DUF899 domain-containing protein n=1 Tax=Kribbella sandramycini TaxID=60450 RepID=A0A7Y4KVI0_9ACTN|nr:DUF899 family protein [Kribbella sandramycini]MBB6567979.1 putative dithiol-disulfide oxidoreductase (DUF899 family) [Kribbella sandramycini]NOL39427.1 DUF899 domain-containing protein [Kribbella sandramycini]